MPDTARPRVLFDIPWRTLFKIITAVALVWLWVQLVQIVLILIVAVLLAVALGPLVRWLERRRLSHVWAVMAVTAGFLLLVGGFFWLTWSSLSAQTHYLLQHLGELQEQIVSKLPSWMQDAIGLSGNSGSGTGGGGAGGGRLGGGVASAVGSFAVPLAQSVTAAITVTVLGFILTIYLLLEGRETRDWLLAFVPRQHRAKTQRTLEQAQTVVFGYMAGNVITSVIAAVSTLVALWILKVPAALLLAILAGLSDFVPVIGFVLSAIPAVLLALTVSVKTAILVVAFYIAYNTVENYFISPWAYGNRMKLSNVAVIVAFAVGAQVAGVIGALIALPIAALYPPIERIWLREKLGDEVVEEHKAIEGEGDESTT